MAYTAHSRRSDAESVMWPQVALVLSVLALTLIGFVMIYSASQVSILSTAASAGTLSDANPAEYLFDQLKFAVIGVVVAAFLWKFVPPEIWKGPALWVVFVAALVLLALTAVMGSTALGAQRWLVLGPISLQPSEFAKIAFILMAARIMDDYNQGELAGKQLGVQIFVLLLLPIAFLYKTQSDLGTTIIIFIGILAVMWLGEVSMQVILVTLGVAFVAALFAIFGTGYRTDRLVVYNPWNDGEGGYGDGYQTIHSFYAFAEGGIFGKGLGNSSEKFDYLPEAETDFVFSIIGEELGLVGAMLVIGLFLVLLFAGLRIARAARTPFGATVAGSCTIMIVFQAFLNIGCVIGLVPTTGKPLPFVSSGGSSLIATFIMVGLILSVASHADTQTVYDRRRANLRVVRAVDEDDVASFDAAPIPAAGRSGARRTHQSAGGSASGRTGQRQRSAYDSRPRGGRYTSRR